MCAEVKKALTDINPKNSAGPDDLDPHCLWKIAGVFPLQEGGNPQVKQSPPPAPNSPTALAAVTNRFLGALARNKNRATLFVDPYL